MAVQKPTIPKGTRDFGPAEVQKRKYILNTIETEFKKYGFMPIETPTMENLSTLEGKYGDEGDKLLFRVLDSGDFVNSSFILKTYLHEILVNAIRDRINDVNWPSNYYKEALKVAILGADSYFLSYSKQINGNDKSALSKLFIEFAELFCDELHEFISSNNEIKIIKDQLYAKIGDLIENPKFLDQFRAVLLDSKVLTSHISEKGLRYDLTVPFARYVVMNRNEITFPFKRYQMQPVWRADRPQKGRYREFWQCDADVVGSDSLLNEVDLIQIYDEAFRNLGIEKYELRVNNRKVLAGIAEVVKSIDAMSTIAIAIDKLDKIGEEGVRKELMEQGFTTDELNKLFDIITIKGENETILNQLKTKLQTSTEGTKGIEELVFVLKALNQSPNQPINLKLDFSLARGLSYYTGCIFEVASTEGSLKSSIGGGGRYDNLTGIFGLPNVSGVGISFGLDRIYDVMEELNKFPQGLNATSTKVMICAFEEETQMNALGILRQLRDNQIASELYPELPQSKKEKENPLQKPMNYADALKIPFRLIIKQDSMILKDIDGKVVPVTTINEIINHIK